MSAGVLDLSTLGTLAERVEAIRSRAPGVRVISRGADLWGANLRGAHLTGADLRGADLRGANLRGVGGVLSIMGLPSGPAILTPTCEGWHLDVGCWGRKPGEGTTAALRDLIAADEGWPEADTDAERARRRPMLAALADLCDTWAAGHQAHLDAVAHWKCARRCGSSGRDMRSLRGEPDE